ncbi:hypothetical protein K1719_000730 [Acacia pycnantha]|nr:hypothetical protein K1719_000730 [Acacia pycnantha]
MEEEEYQGATCCCFCEKQVNNGVDFLRHVCDLKIKALLLIRFRMGEGVWEMFKRRDIIREIAEEHECNF